MREVAEWNGRRLNHRSGIRFLDFLRDERIINFKAGKTTQMHRQKVCTSPAIASRWLTLTTTYTIDALARAYTHMHIYTSAHKLQQRRSTRRYRYTCIYIYVRDTRPRIYVYGWLPWVYIGCRLTGIWAKQFREECKKKKKRKKDSSSIELPSKKASLVVVRTRKRVCLVCWDELKKYWNRCGRLLVDVFRSTKGRCKDIFFLSNSIRLTKKTETANINKLKRERILLSVDENVNFSREIDIVCIIGHVFVCFVHCYWPVVNKFYRHEIYKRETIVRDRPAYLHQQSGWCC